MAGRKIIVATLPYVKFRLESTDALKAWDPAIWAEIDGDRACIEISKDGNAFYWGAWESHHETVAIPASGCEAYKAIFRRYKGFYDGEPWDQYANEIYVFAPIE